MTKSADPGSYYTTVTWEIPEARDGDHLRYIDVTSTHSPSSRFNIGNTTVEYTATDPAGNRGSCKFTVTVIGKT